MGGHRAAAAFSVPASTSGSPTNSIADEGGGGDSGSGDSGSGTTHLAMESGIYGSLQSTETMQGDFSLEGTHYNTVCLCVSGEQQHVSAVCVRVLGLRVSNRERNMHDGCTDNNTWESS